MRDPSDDAADAVTGTGEATDGAIDGVTGGAAARGTERRCLLSGARADRADLVRLVADADGRVWPDVAARLPGRGAWILPDRPALERAIGRGQLAAALSRALRSKAMVGEDLPERIAAALEQHALQRLGLAQRAGQLVLGGDKLQERIAARRIFLLLHAADAARDGAARLDRLWQASGGNADCRLVLPAGRDALSRALGRENVVHSGVRNGKAAARIARELRRWAAFSSGNRNPTAGDRNASGRRDDEGQE